MIKQIVLISAREGMSRQDFRTHYETVHVPLVLSLFPMLRDYRRNYVRAPDMAGSPALGFDVVTELWFDDAEAHAAFRARAALPEVRRRIRADEAKFLRRGEIRSFMVDEVGR